MNVGASIARPYGRRLRIRRNLSEIVSISRRAANGRPYIIIGIWYDKRSFIAAGNLPKPDILSCFGGMTVL